MFALVVIGAVLIVAMTFYLSRRSNQNAVDRLRYIAPYDATKLDQLRAEQAARTQSANDGIEGPF